MILAHKIRLIPSKEDINYFIKCCGVSRFTYNWALNKWNSQYQTGSKPTALKLKKEFNVVKKKEYPWMYEVTKTAPKLHYHIACIRNDALHKLTYYLSTNFSLVAIEDLNVKGMVQNRKLSKAILDMGFGEFRRQLNYKATLNFSEVTVVDRFFPSSKLCSACSNKKIDLKLSNRIYKCDKCGFEIDRDLNASINILKEAL